MSRRAVGDQAMSGAERQRRYIAKKLAKPAPAAGDLMIKVEHLRRWPDRTAAWLHRELGGAATIALRNALDQAITAPADTQDER